MRFVQRVLSIMIALVCLSPWSAFAAGSERSARVVTSSYPNLDLVVLMDQSGSQLTTDPYPDTYSEDPNTPATRRMAALEALVDTIVAQGEHGSDVRLAVIMFGTKSVVVTPFQTVATLDDGDRIKREVRRRHFGDLRDMQWTDIDLTLQAAQALLAAHHDADHKPVLVVITDGRPENAAANHSSPLDVQQRYLDAALTTFDAFTAFTYGPGLPCPPAKPGTPVYVVPVHVPEETEFDKPIYQNFWQTMADRSGGSFYPVTMDQDVELISHEVAQAYGDMVCSPYTGSPYDVQGEERVPVDVGAIYVEVAFTVLKDDPNIGVVIYRPDVDGSQANLDDQAEADRLLVRNQLGDPDVKVASSYLDEVWDVRRSPTQPWAGRWTVKLTGHGRVWVHLTMISDIFKSEFRPLCQVYGMGQAVPIEVQVRDSQGSPVAPGVIIEPSQMTVQQAGQVVQTLTYQLDGSTYRSRFLATTPGKYQIGLSSMLQYGSIQQAVDWPPSREFEIGPDTGTYPWLHIDAPGDSEGVSQQSQIDIQATLFLADGTVADMVAQDPAARVAAWVYSNSTLVGRFDMALTPLLGLSTYVAELPAGTLPVGAVNIRVDLDSDVWHVCNSPDEVTVLVGAGGPADTPTPPPTAPPTATLTATPTATLTLTATPTVTPAPVVPPDGNGLGWVDPMLLAGILGALMVPGAFLLWRGRPSTAGMSFNGPDGPLYLKSGLIGSRMPQKVDLVDSMKGQGTNGMVAQLEIAPRGSGTAHARVLQLAQGQKLHTGNPLNSVDVGKGFDLTNGTVVTVGTSQFLFDA